jgi:PAS domain S-box-containing protein
MTKTDETGPRHDALRKRLREAFEGDQGSFAQAVLRSVVDCVPAYVAFASPDGQLLYMHHFAEGYEEADVADASVYDFMDAPSIEVTRRTIERVTRTAELEKYEVVSPGPDGTHSHYEVQAVPIVEDGEVTVLALVGTDVTDIARAERELQASREDLALAIEATGMGIWTWDARTNEVVWDDMTCRHFGLPPGEGAPTYQDYLAQVFPADREAVSRSIGRAMESGTYEDLLHRIVIDGEIRWVLIKGRVIMGAEGQAIGIRGGVFDVTERQRIELEMRERQKIVSLEQLAAGVAHNFNNMLMAIMGNLSVLEGQVAPSLRSRVEAAVSASEAAADVVRSLSALTRSVGPAPKRRRTRVRELAERAARIVRGTFTSDVAFELDVRLAAGDDPWIEVLGGDLEHALLNLCMNGRDAVREAGPPDPRVTLSVTRRPHRPNELRDWVELAVHDNGAGMDEATRERLFEPFFTTKETGTGIGLFTALRTVNEHGGLLDVRSSPGEGTTFLLLLPAGPPLD